MSHPTASTALSAPTVIAPTNAPTFSSLSHLLDARLLRALSKLGFAHPTPVQSKLLPLALQGRDVLAQAPTGSGKTLAYALPAVQRVLAAKTPIALTDPARQATRCLILVPTRELAEQVAQQLGALLAYLGSESVAVLNAAREGDKGVQKLLLSSRPDIVISTPSRALTHLASASLDLSALQLLVLDEADLILSYGHAADVKAILSGGSGGAKGAARMPARWQNLLLSATLGGEVRRLMGAKLRKPVILRLTPATHSTHLAQYSVHLASQTDKFLLLYVILKLRLVRGKCIVFVNSTERAYRVRLFLEQFGIRATVLNEELPAESRFHIVQEFNKGVYDYIIATDESRLGVDAAGGNEADDEVVDQVTGPEVEEEEEEEEDGEGDELDQVVEKGKEKLIEVEAEDEDDEDDEEEEENEAEQVGTSKKRKPSSSVASKSTKRSKTSMPSKRGVDAEYGVSRGVDFLSVACVINFDLPVSSRGYTHRVGRTARAGHTGTSLSFIVPAEVFHAEGGASGKKGLGCATAEFDEVVWTRIVENQRRRGAEVKEWAFDRNQVESFRYRMEDAIRSVTRAAIREARIKEIKQEILNSEKLKAHFEDNPHDLAYLRHDKALHPARVQPHMKHVPAYLMPRIQKLRQPAPSAGADDAGAGVEASASGAGETSKVSYDEEGRAIGYVGLKPQQRGGRGGRGGMRGGRGGRGGRGAGGRGGKGKKADPLRKFGK